MQGGPYQIIDETHVLWTLDHYESTDAFEAVLEDLPVTTPADQEMLVTVQGDYLKVSRYHEAPPMPDEQAELLRRMDCP